MERKRTLELHAYPLVLAAGFLAGFINTIAGSGSLITLPLLIFLGLPANVANGTNRVAILLQNIVGANSFRRQGALDLRGAFLLALPAMLGAVAGAQIAVNLDEAAMRRAIGVLLIVMLVILLVRPQRWLQGSLTSLRSIPSIPHLGLFFLVGAYGGFIQAGVGLFLLAALVLGVGYDLIRANAVKVGIVLLFTVPALAVFVRNGQVLLGIGVLMGLGNMVGAWVAARFAVARGAVWVRRLLVLVVAGSAAQLLGLADLVLGLIR